MRPRRAYEPPKLLTPTVTEHVLYQQPTIHIKKQHRPGFQSLRSRRARPVMTRAQQRRCLPRRPRPGTRQAAIAAPKMATLSPAEHQSLLKHVSSTSLCLAPAKAWITEPIAHDQGVQQGDSGHLAIKRTASDARERPIQPPMLYPSISKKRKLSSLTERKAASVPILRPMPSAEDAFARFSSAIHDSESDESSDDDERPAPAAKAPPQIAAQTLPTLADSLPPRRLSRSVSPVLYAKTLTVPSHRPVRDAAGAFARFSAFVHESDSSEDDSSDDGVQAPPSAAQANTQSTSTATAGYAQEVSPKSAASSSDHDWAVSEQADGSDQQTTTELEVDHDGTSTIEEPQDMVLNDESLHEQLSEQVRKAASRKDSSASNSEHQPMIASDRSGHDLNEVGSDLKLQPSNSPSDDIDDLDGAQKEEDEQNDQLINTKTIKGAITADIALYMDDDSHMVDAELDCPTAEALPSSQHVQVDSDDKFMGFDDDERSMHEQHSMETQTQQPDRTEDAVEDSDAEDEFQEAQNGSHLSISPGEDVEDSADTAVQPSDEATTPTRATPMGSIAQLPSAQSGPYFTPTYERARDGSPDSLATSRVPSQVSASQESEAEVDELQSFAGSLETQQILCPVPSLVKAQEQDEFSVLRDIKDVWEEVSTITRTGSPWSLDDEVYDITHPHALNLTPIICNMARQSTIDEPSPLKRKRKAGVSSALFPPVAETKFGLLQEKLWQEPFWLLIGTTFLNKTAGRVAAPIFWQLKEQYKTPQALAEAKEEELTELIWTLGLQRQRARRMLKMARAWSTDEPTVGKRYRTINYPINGDGKQYKQGELIEGDESDARGALEIGHIPGCGAYAFDSWRIFCRDVMRGVASDYNGRDAGKDFEPEWKRVLPDDKELRPYLRWMWLREGWIWDAETGMKRRTTDDEWAAAVQGQIEPTDETEQEITAAVKEEESELRRDPKRRTRSSMKHE